MICQYHNYFLSLCQHSPTVFASDIFFSERKTPYHLLSISYANYVQQKTNGVLIHLQAKFNAIPRALSQGHLAPHSSAQPRLHLCHSSIQCNSITFFLTLLFISVLQLVHLVQKHCIDKMYLSKTTIIIGDFLCKDAQIHIF